MAEDTWDPAGGEQVPTEQVCERLRARAARTPALEGVTLLGGEPFEQAGPLGELARTARALGLSVIAFTGYTIEELQAREDPSTNELLGHIDLLIDGPYQEALRDFSRPWAGSSNQRFLFLSDRYGEEDLAREANHVEMRIGKDGTVVINGMMDFLAV